jgi:hypothetical protein
MWRNILAVALQDREWQGIEIWHTTPRAGWWVSLLGACVRNTMWGLPRRFVLIFSRAAA